MRKNYYARHTYQWLHISTSLHRQMQSIRFILASFCLAPVGGANNLTTLLCNKLWHCWIWKTKKALRGTKTGNVFPKPMQRHKLSRVSCFKTIVIPKKENKTLRANWCYPKMAHHITNQNLMASMLPICALHQSLPDHSIPLPWNYKFLPLWYAQLSKITVSRHPFLCFCQLKRLAFGNHNVVVCPRVACLPSTETI